MLSPQPPRQTSRMGPIFPTAHPLTDESALWLCCLHSSMSGLPSKNRTKGARCVLDGKPPSDTGNSVPACGVVPGDWTWGAAPGDLASLRPPPYLGTLTFLDMNVIPIFLLMGSMRGWGSVLPPVELPRLVGRGQPNVRRQELVWFVNKVPPSGSAIQDREVGVSKNPHPLSPSVYSGEFILREE